MKENTFDVICILNCESLSGAKLFKNKKYKCIKIGESCYIYDSNNDITPLLRLDHDSISHHDTFPKYFVSLKEYRKLKLKKLNETNL